MHVSKLPKTSSEILQVTVPSHVFLPRGMLVNDEVVLFYLLARDVYSGTGEIIDGGAFCGASAYAFASGLNDNIIVEEKKKHGRIHSYDLFVSESYTTEYIQNNFYYYTNLTGDKKFKKFDFCHGESFLDIYKFQTQRYENFIECNQGSILDFNWSGQPIEILFIDVAKTLDIQNHLFRSFLPSLIPDIGILIQQDFHHAYHPYIHVAMEYLSPYFEITHSKIVFGSRCYRLKSVIPDEVINRVSNYSFTVTECLSLMRQCIESSPISEQYLLRICEARLMVNLQCYDLATIAITKFVEDYSSHPGFSSWMVPEMKKAVGELAIKILS